MSFQITKETTNQEIFDHVANHLRIQGRQSVEALFGGCAYRASGNLSCAIGCLIPPAVYTSSLEGRRVVQLVQDKLTFARQIEYLGLNDYNRLKLLAELQQIHDEKSSWVSRGFIGEKKLKRCAKNNGLIYHESVLAFETA